MIHIEKHTTLNKSFDFNTSELNMRVDYDDVNHAEVDAAVQQLQEILRTHWNPERHKELLKVEVMKTWEANEYGLQKDYEEEGGLEGYLRDNGVSATHN